MRTLNLVETAQVWGGTQTNQGNQPGYDGGATPPGFSDVDGSGRFMYDGQGEMHINPNYRDYLNARENQIDWGGVALDLTAITGGAYGGIAVGAARQFIGWGLSSLSAYFKANKGNQSHEQQQDAAPQH